MRTSYIGHAINFSARLESTSIPGKIHVSNEIITLLNSNNNKFNYKYVITKRNEPIELKGIGTYNTFFIE
jgi:class 3 adenylate cyclase